MVLIFFDPLSVNRYVAGIGPYVYPNLSRFVGGPCIDAVWIIFGDSLGSTLLEKRWKSIAEHSRRWYETINPGQAGSRYSCVFSSFVLFTHESQLCQVKPVRQNRSKIGRTRT